MILPVIVKKFETKEGRAFFGASVGAAILAEKLADPASCAEFTGEVLPTDKRFSFRPIGVMTPTKEGVYLVTFSGAWIDSREGYREKSIIRAKDVAFEFRKDLPNLDSRDAAVANLPKDK